MIPPIVQSIIPIPSLLILLLITLYHLTPLLNLLPNLTPTFQKLSQIIPHPRKSRNLPREFFSLPPRPGSPLVNPTHKSKGEDDDLSIRGRLGVRGTLMIILLVEALISLACGWSFLSSFHSDQKVDSWGLITTSLVLLPTTITYLTLFTILSKPPIIMNRYSHAQDYTSQVRKLIFKNGGITHSTLIPRILPLSLLTSTIGITLSSVIPPQYGGYCILGYTSLCLVVVLLSGGMGMWRMITKPREGLIRLRGESRMSLYEKERALSPETESTYRVSNEIHVTPQEDGNGVMERIGDTSSWLSSPSRPPTPVSSFDYSTPQGTISTAATHTKDSYKTPKSKQSNSSFAASPSFAIPTTTGQIGYSDFSGSAAEAVINDQSWLSEPTNTPSSISAWSFPNSPNSPVSPQPAITRNRSPSPSNVPLSPDEEGRHPNLPQPIENRIPPQKSSNSTTYTYATSTGTPGSGLRSTVIDGSILADYSPDPFQPLPPRGFASLSTLHNLQSTTSLSTRVAALRSGSTLAIIPVPEEGSSTSNFQSYHSTPADADAYKTPDHKSSRARKVLSTAERRAPPPPPMPVDMPLPPTPTVARSSTLFEIQGKDSMEVLLGNGNGSGNGNGDWVEVEHEEEALEDWGRGGKGVGLLAVVGITICYGLSLPLLLSGPTSMAIMLYLISILLPAPTLAITSYLLRYRPMVISSVAQSKKGSTKSTSTVHRSLAPLSESQLSLPLSISPKLTPPAPKRASTMNLASPTFSKMIASKPSLTTFVGAGTGSGRSPERRHTVYGALSFKDIQAEENLRKTLARRSGDVWISNGHAIEGGGLISRATEMLKPVPAMRVLQDSQKPNKENTGKRMSGGVVSMLAKRASNLFHHSEIQDDNVELGQFEDAEISNGNIQLHLLEAASPARSGIAISIIAPSPEKRLSRATNPRTGSSYSTGENEGEGEGETELEVDASYGTAEIGMAKRGRMSNGPMFIFNKEKGKGKQDDEDGVRGYELDWLTAGVLPGLVPSIKIGNDVRVEPAPHSAPLTSTAYAGSDTPKARQRPLSDMPVSPAQEGDSSYVTMPSFKASSFKQSTPHGRKHAHTRSYSSSIDFNLPSEYYTAETATSISRELRQRNLGLGRSDTIESRRTITHKPSFGLPKLHTEKDDFEGEIRKSIDDLQQRPSFSEICQENASDGIDLPPIPMTLTHKPSLSRVSEMTEEATLASSTNSGKSVPRNDASENSAIFSESALEDMHLALALGTSTPASNSKDARLRPKSSDDSTTTGDLSINHSILTNDEGLEEMERMLAMDTPTRAEFVISPPASSTNGGRDSRASDRSISTFATTTSGYTTTTSTNVVESPAPPVPNLPMEYRQPAYPTTTAFLSHPHPPPLNSMNSQTDWSNPNSNLSRQVSMPNIGAHPPIQRILPKRSIETLHSVSSDDPVTPKVKHQQSKRELKLVKELEKRNSLIQFKSPQDQNHGQRQGEGRSHSALGFSSNTNTKKQDGNTVAEKRGLRPLTLVTDNTSNKRSSVISGGEKSGNNLKNKRFSVLQEDNGSKSSVGNSGKGKMSSGSAVGKENGNRKGSKMSNGPGIPTARVLRA